MSTFSGLLVSMTGALAHDVYGRMLRPKSTPDQRMRAFKVCAVLVGGVAIILGMQVEPFQINFMVGQAFAIAAASYFPLLFVSCWWRGLTMNEGRRHRHVHRRPLRDRRHQPDQLQRPRRGGRSDGDDLRRVCALERL